MTFEWLNEPPQWSGNPDRLEVTTGEETDFWQKTFYGFQRNTGHAYMAPVSGDFSLSAQVTGKYEALYDQAGLILYLDESNWIKTGIEYTDGLMHFSVVVTRETSDWSVIPLPDTKPIDELKVRLTRHEDAVRVQYDIRDSGWKMARLAPFPAGDMRAGVMACSPQRSGFQAAFRDIAIGPPSERKLHDD